MAYDPTLDSVKEHPLPRWFSDAKLGIFIHWGPYSVPAYAPRHELIDNLRKGGWSYHFKNNPYAEWYMNSMKIRDSPTWKHHDRRYGRDFDYFEFGDILKESMGRWDCRAWSELFQKSHAKYVVMGAKHHDGFLMFDSEDEQMNREGWCMERDVIGDVGRSVRKKGLKYGVYYSSALDWTFKDETITCMADMLSNGSTDTRYLDYVWNHWLEMIRRYEPDVLWSDIGFPPGRDISELFSHYYNSVEDGLVNDRWMQTPASIQWLFRRYPIRKVIDYFARRMLLKGKVTTLQPPHCDYLTPEYSSFDEINEKKWECVRGLGTSFGYNSMETTDDYISFRELIHLFVDIVSKNGNLMINVGPTAEGEIPKEQRELLIKMGGWLDLYGEAMFGTRPYDIPGGTTSNGVEYRFTRKDEQLYITVLDPIPGKILQFTGFDKYDDCYHLGYDEPVLMKKKKGRSKIKLPQNIGKNSPACSLKLV